MRIGEYLGLGKKQITNLKNEDNIYQIPLDEEEKFRAIGILRTSGEKYLFELLFLDPNHLFYPNLAKAEYPYGDKAICLMSKANCFQISECQPLPLKDWRKMITERNKTKRKRI